MPEYLPFAPPPLPVDAVSPEEKLTNTQQEKYKHLLEHFSKDQYTLPGVAENAQLTEEEKFWLSRECLMRYLRASKWVQATAVTRLESTLKWRREYGIYTTLTPEYVEPEATTGKEVIFGYDTLRRPALYLFPSRQNTEESDRQIAYVVWALEACICMMGPGVETTVLLTNYGDKGKSSSLSFSKQLFDIIQNHYPERLGSSLIINVPFLFSALVKLISPFIDPVTRAKFRLNQKPIEEGMFTKEQAIADGWGGTRDFAWSHEQYWPALLKLINERKKAWMACWKEQGGAIGIREWDYKRAAESAQPTTS